MGNHMINYDTESLGGSLHVESLKIRYMAQCNDPYGVPKMSASQIHY